MYYFLLLWILLVGIILKGDLKLSSQAPKIFSSRINRFFIIDLFLMV